MQNENEQDEVRFWRELIEHWRSTHAEEVPRRLREALEAAETRFRSACEFISHQAKRPH